MRMVWAGIVPAIVMLAHAVGPPTAEAHWFGRCGGYYSPRYSYGYSYYRPSYYGNSYYGYSNYGYCNSGYAGYGYGANPYGMASGFGGNSALTTILAMNGGLGGANSSMYMTVPMSNGYGPASLLQVPLGGSGRPTYLQVPMGGGPGQPVYLQMELGGGASAPTPAAPIPPAPRSVGSREVLSTDRVAVAETSASFDEVRDDLAPDDAIAETASPFVVGRRPVPEVSAVATTDVDDATAPSIGAVPSVATGPFRFAVFEKPAAATTATSTPPNTAEVRKAVTEASQDFESSASEKPAAEPSLSDSSVPWRVK